MELQQAGISEQPFRPRGRPLAFVPYLGQVAAMQFMRSVQSCPRGLGLLQGPSLSGKSTIINEFVENLDDEVSSAVINGSGLDAINMLGSIIREFGFELKLDSLSELMNMIRVFAMQQVAWHDAPVLIIENAHALKPDAMQALCELADIKDESGCALRIILVSDRAMDATLHSPGNAVLAARLTGTYNLVPMTKEETCRYLQTKLKAGGCEDPKALVPDDVCAKLHEASGGWPGIVDRLIALALARAEAVPLSTENIECPTIPELTGKAGLQSFDESPVEVTQAYLYLSQKGRTLQKIPLTGERLIIGRSDHNDVSIPSRFISKHHLLFVRDENTTLLMDLNSTNGTFVNSRRISNHIMVHEDVINLGHHVLKFYDPNAVDITPLHDHSLDETIIMKGVDDMRGLVARQRTRLVAPTKN